MSWARASIAISLLTLLAMAGFGLAIHFWRVLPLWDQWETVFLYQRWLEHGWAGTNIAAQHNEHRHLLTNLVFLADYEFFRGTSALAWSCLIGVQLVLGAWLGWLATEGDRPANRALGLATAIALIASPLQIDNLILPFHIAIPLVCLLALLAFYASAMAAVAPAPLAWIYSAIACVAVVLCPYAMANGVIASLMAGMLALVLAGPRAHVSAIALAAIAAVTCFFWDWVLPQHHTGLLASATGFAGLWHIPAHSLLLLGSPGLVWGAEGAGFVGLVGFVLWLSASCLWWRRRADLRVDASTVALLGLTTFALATAIMVASGRAGAGLGQALSGRYATFSLVFWMSLLGSLWRLCKAKEQAWWPWRRGVLALVTVLLALGYGAWFRAVSTWNAQVAISDRVAAELRAGNSDPKDLALVYPHVDRLLPAVDFLRQRKLSIFAP